LTYFYFVAIPDDAMDVDRIVDEDKDSDPDKVRLIIIIIIQNNSL
jgi:hypothetical protein